MSAKRDRDKFRRLAKALLQDPEFCRAGNEKKLARLVEAFTCVTKKGFIPLLGPFVVEISAALINHAGGRQLTVSRNKLLQILAENCPDMMRWLDQRGITVSDWLAGRKKVLDCSGIDVLEDEPSERLLLSRALNQLLSQTGRMCKAVFTSGQDPATFIIFRQRPDDDPDENAFQFHVDDRCLLCLSSLQECNTRVPVCGPGGRKCPHGHTTCGDCKGQTFTLCPMCREPLM